MRLKGTEAIGLVVLPIAFVRVSVWTPKLAFAVGLIVEPLSFVFGLVRPALHPVGTFFAFLVDVARVERVLHNLDVLHKLKLVLINHLAQLDNLLSRPTIETLEVCITGCIQLLLIPQT